MSVDRSNNSVTKWLLAMLLLFSGASAANNGLTLKKGKPFCEAYNCSHILPSADIFQQSKTISLPVIEALKGGKVFAYLFLSTDLVDIPAYSGKPMVTLIAIDANGKILNAEIVHHSEPILLVGIPESVLEVFMAQYIGKNISDHFEITSGGVLSHGADQKVEASEKHEIVEVAGHVPIDMITGATVTAQVIDQTLIASSRMVAQALGILPPDDTRIVTWHADYQPKTWDELVEEGSIDHLLVPTSDLVPNADKDEAWVDIYFADVTQPIIGINILGESNYNWVKERAGEDGKAFVIVSNGKDSYKGSGFVRGGIFERFYFEQSFHKYVFRDLSYEHLYGIKIDGAPDFKESGLFFLNEKHFDSSNNWQFHYIASHLTGETATSKIFKTYSVNYQLPEKYFDLTIIEKELGPSLVEKVWKMKFGEVLLLSLFLMATLFLCSRRDLMTTSVKRLETTHIITLLLSVVIIGLVLKSPPSMAHIYPLLLTFEKGMQLDFYLSDPIQFVFWSVIALSLIWLGRGWFCGWICPYGALLELTHRLSRRILPKKYIYNFSPKVDGVLDKLRYVILFSLIAISLFSIEMAERLTEVEPFKTTWIVGIFSREWYLTLYWFALFGIGIFIYRFFCRYLCPLGAILSLASYLQIKRIKRYDACQSCKACGVKCETLAINTDGDIDHFKCYACFDCEQSYSDDNVCPPRVYLVKGKIDRISKADIDAIQSNIPTSQPSQHNSKGKSH
ncbi:4Fe-4S binding protein [Pseudomonadota bacterium]